MNKMWRPKLRTVCCCLMLLCANSGTHGASYQLRRNHRPDVHPVDRDLLTADPGRNHLDKDSEMVYNHVNHIEYYKDNEEADRRHKGRQSVQKSFNLITSEEQDQLHEEKKKERKKEAHDKGIDFIESFYLKELRIEVQKQKIIDAFPPGELEVTQEESENSSETREDLSDNKIYSNEEEEQKDRKEMLDFVWNVRSTMEVDHRDEPLKVKEQQLEVADGWLNSFRPIYLFIKEHMSRFEAELIEHKRKVDRLLKQAKQTQAYEYFDEDDIPYDITDFVHETEQRELIFLDEVECDDVYNGYYPTSPRPPTHKGYLNFCLQIDSHKFQNMVDAKQDPLVTNSVSDLPQLQIRKAELWFYKATPDAMDSHNQMFSLTSIGNWDDAGKHKKFETISLKQSSTSIGWIRADIGKPLVDWLSPMAFATLHRGHNHKRNDTVNQIRKRNTNAYYMWKRNFERLSKHKFFINVSCKTCMGGSTSTTSAEEDQQRNSTTTTTIQDHFRPFILVDYKRIDRTKHVEKESRTRRERRNLECGKHPTECCRESLWIEFSKIGMEYILSPKGYHANYCRGNCNTAAANALRSAHNSLLNVYSRDHLRWARDVGFKSCCSPTEYSNINVTYINKKTNELKTNEPLKNFVVKSCGCN